MMCYIGLIFIYLLTSGEARCCALTSNHQFYVVFLWTDHTCYWNTDWECCMCRIIIACWMHPLMQWTNYIKHTSIQLFSLSNTSQLNRFGKYSFFDACNVSATVFIDITMALLSISVCLWCFLLLARYIPDISLMNNEDRPTFLDVSWYS